MKKTLHLLSYLIPVLGLGALWYFIDCSFSTNAAFFILYGICLLICPLMGILRLSKFCRGLFSGIAIFSFSCGIPTGMALGGFWAAQAVLAVGSISLGILLVYFSLPKGTTEETHLVLRGMRPARARKKLLLRTSYAFFFEKTSALAAVLSVWQLFIAQTAAPGALWSAAVLTVAISFVSYLFYLALGAPTAAPLQAQPKKSKYIVISLLVFVLILSAVYIYVGSAYTSPDPTLAAALSAVQAVLTPALLAAAAGYVLGMLLGLLFSVCGAHFFATLCRGTQLVPTALFAALLHFLLPHTVVSLAIPLVLMTALGMLQSRLAVRPYRQLPMSGRKKVVILPLFHLANLALLPRLLTCALFSAIFIDVTGSGVLSRLPALSFVFASSILAVTIGILYILCLLTKEVRHHG